MTENYDVIIIGGGPAGTTIGAKLASRGRKVLILERHKFPRFHIGESITAFGFTVFKELGVYDELAAINEVKKKGLEFVMHEKSYKVFFVPENRDNPQVWAFQMARSKLDEVLLNNARRSGVEVREEQLVKRVIFSGDKAIGVEYKDFSNGATEETQCVYGRWIVDASGQAAVINHQLKNNWYNDPLLEKKMAVFSHWRGDIEVTNSDDEINFKLCVHENRRDWAWYIPVAKDTLSLGVVLSQETVKREGQSRTLEEIFYGYAEGLPFISDILKNPTLKTVEKFRCVKDYSYRSKRYYGNHWVIVGDSAGFIDPVFSTGLQVAFNSAYALIDPLNEVLDHEDPDISRLEPYHRALDRYYRVNSMLVYLFYLCRLDHDLLQDGWHLWKTIEWASPRERLAFAWHAWRFLRTDQRQQKRWKGQVLFGNPAQENVLADLCMALSRNYDKIFERRYQQRQLNATGPVSWSNPMDEV